jgi:hypothetical protein
MGYAAHLNISQVLFVDRYEARSPPLYKNSIIKTDTQIGRPL